MRQIYRTGQPLRRFSKEDMWVFLGVAALIYVGVRLALSAHATVPGPEIRLDPKVLPYYAMRSLLRMAAAYLLSLLFALGYGYIAAKHARAEQILIPLLDVLQSVPILSFLPVVLLGLTAILPRAIAVELASVVLIFTSQVWNLTFSWYQSLKTVPKEYREASRIFRFNGWLRFKSLELPFATPGLVWNSMMSWAGGWFFLMAAEIFQVGSRDFRLPGLGSYLQEAANQGNLRAILWGLGALILLIVALDQLVWRPLIAWSERFTLEMVEREYPTRSWFYDLLRKTSVLRLVSEWFAAVSERFDAWTVQRWAFGASQEAEGAPSRWHWVGRVMGALVGVGVLYAALRGAGLLLEVPLGQWWGIAQGLAATTLRVWVALVVALAWTVPVGVAIGMNPRLASWLQPIVQMVAAVPATALFPVFVLMLVALPGGLNMAAVLLMLMGTQWYLLFNVIAGASTIPQDLHYTAALLGLSRWERWRTLILPALFPYLVTGAITASGGAWNASIVAEYIQFGGRTLQTVGLGATIASATAAGDYPLLLAATLVMIATVVAINRLFWRRLYRLAEERFRME
ncbi:MAG TPA: ABC transporter permease subunit [Chloroflexi bacterium]|nr:ABC transporter permease subunit [Chloroflexota bacterium]